MGRKGGLSPIAGLAGKALKKRKAVGAGLRGAKGKSQADSFMDLFTRRLQEKAAAEPSREKQRAAIGERLRARGGAGGGVGGLFGRLFGIGG